jgi:hypothetical protein
MSTTPARQPQGQPTGGQFAAKSNPESEVDLDDVAGADGSSSAFWTQHVDSADSDPTSVSGQLQEADAKFHRPAVPAVFAEYQEFMASGRFPYITDVVGEIVKKHDVVEELHKQLGHEVYLASGQFKLGKMVSQEADLTELGYRPITEFEPVDGAKIQFPGGVTYRVKEDGRGGWALLPPKNRTHGISLGSVVAQHRAYETAKEEGQLRMNGPQVRMFTSPAAPSRRSR